MTTIPTTIPADWAWTQTFWASLDEAPQRVPTPLLATDAPEDLADDTIPRNLAALVWGCVLGGALLGVLIGSLSAWVAP